MVHTANQMTQFITIHSAKSHVRVKSNVTFHTEYSSHLVVIVVVLEDKFVENSSDRSTKERTDPEDPVVIPGLVRHEGGAEAPGGVDAGAGVGDEEEMGH